MLLRQPDHFLEVDTTSLSRMPVGVLVGGGGADVGVARRRARPRRHQLQHRAADCQADVRIPVHHMEAANRSFDYNVPEGVNRRLVDHVADFDLVYTEHSRRHLLAEGLPPCRMTLTGSPMREVLEHFREPISAAGVLENLGPGPGSTSW